VEVAVAVVVVLKQLVEVVMVVAMFQMLLVLVVMVLVVQGAMVVYVPRINNAHAIIIEGDKLEKGHVYPNGYKSLSSIYGSGFDSYGSEFLRI
jgi:hypothetical protein